MIQLFTYPRVPDDTALAVALVGPARLVRGKDKTSSVEYVDFSTTPVDLGQGAATVVRHDDGTLVVDFGSSTKTFDEAAQQALIAEGGRILSQWPAELTYPMHYLGASYDLAFGADPRAVVDRSWHTMAVSKTVLCTDEHFERAGQRLFNWQVHAAARVGTVVNETARVNTRVSTKFGPTVSPCIVVEAIRTDTEVCLIYGTAKGHVESGEEAFILTREGGGLATARVAAFSRQAWFPARVAAPVARRLQEMYLRRYLLAMIPG